MSMRLAVIPQTSHIMRGNSAGAVSAFVCTQNGAMPMIFHIFLVVPAINGKCRGA